MGLEEGAVGLAALRLAAAQVKILIIGLGFVSRLALSDFSGVRSSGHGWS
jgi:hypothetical protein